jgi:hypothetical protein
VLPSAQGILNGLFTAFQQPDSTENEYLMRAVMRLISFLGPQIAPVAPLCLKVGVCVVNIGKKEGGGQPDSTLNQNRMCAVVWPSSFLGPPIAPMAPLCLKAVVLGSQRSTILMLLLPPPGGFCCCCSCWEAVAIRSCSHDKIESSQHDTII